MSFHGPLWGHRGKEEHFQYTWRESSDYKTSILKSVRRFVANVILVEKRNCSITKCKNIYSFEGNRIELRHANTTALRYSPSLTPYNINLPKPWSIIVDTLRQKNKTGKKRHGSPAAHHNARSRIYHTFFSLMSSSIMLVIKFLDIISDSSDWLVDSNNFVEDV